MSLDAGFIVSKMFEELSMYDDFGKPYKDAREPREESVISFREKSSSIEICLNCHQESYT